MPDNDIPVIAFDNQLAYDVVVYDSFDYDDDDDDTSTSNGSNGQPDSQAYFATLTQLGIVPAGQTVNIQPIHDSSAFVVESTADKKPIKRLMALSFDDITALSIEKADEAAMTQTFQFVSFFLNNPNDSVSVAFNKVLNDTTDDLATGIDNFLQGQPAYNQCCFEDYMMAMAYTALHPLTPNPSQPSGTSSLKTISQLMGTTWSEFLADIFVTKFSITTKEKHLILTFEVDISTLPFETAEIAANVMAMLNGTKVVKAQIMFNYAIGLNILGTRLSLQFDAMTIPIGSSKTLSMKKPQVSIDINPLFKFVVFTVEATFPFNVNGKTFDALASFVIDNDEAAIGVDIKGDHTSLPAPPGIKGLHFDEFGVGMGLFFKPPGFGVGIQGKFHIGDSSNNVISLDDDTFAIVCEYVEEAIDPKYIAFSIPQLNLNQVIQLFTNANPNIDIPVNFTDLSFHWSDSLMDAVVLPDGTLSAGGYGFSAAVNIFSFGFYGAANLDLNSGLTANVEASPINLKNIFKLEGDGKGFSLKYDANGNPIPPNIVATTQAEKDAVANATDKQIVAPGGPSLIINTLSMPILHLNAKASLFDLLDYAITADINKDGIKFELDYGAILTQQMICNLTNFHNFYGQFGYFINRSIQIPPIAGVNIGSIPLNADASLHLSINTSLTGIVIKTGGQFDFEGYHFSFGDFTADINISKISDFLESIITYIKNEAKTIFAQILDTAEHWAAAAKKGIVTGFDDAGKVMKNAYNKAAQDMTVILKAAGFAANDVANALKNGYGALSQDVASIMKQAGFAANEVADAIKNAWNCGLNDVAWAMQWVGYSATEVGRAVQHTFGTLAQDAVNDLMHLSYTANEIGAMLKDAYGKASQDVAAIMKAAGYKAEEVADAIKNAWNCTYKDVAWAMQWVGYSATEVGKAIQHSFGTLAQDAANFLKTLSYAANDIGSMIKDAFGGDSVGVAKVMKAAGYKAEEVGGAIRNAWNCAVSDVVWAMQQVAYGAQEIAGAIKAAFGDVAQDLANAFRQFGIGAQDAADAVKNVFGKVINDTASILKQAGYAASDVASSLKDAFNTSVDAVASAMKDVGYAANDVKNAFDELGGDFKSFADTAWGDVKHYMNPSNW